MSAFPSRRHVLPIATEETGPTETIVRIAEGPPAPTTTRTNASEGSGRSARIEAAARRLDHAYGPRPVGAMWTVTQEMVDAWRELQEALESVELLTDGYWATPEDPQPSWKEADPASPDDVRAIRWPEELATRLRNTLRSRAGYEAWKANPEPPCTECGGGKGLGHTADCPVAGDR